jgi:hypothetical protein
VLTRFPSDGFRVNRREHRGSTAIHTESRAVSRSVPVAYLVLTRRNRARRLRDRQLCRDGPLRFACATTSHSLNLHLYCFQPPSINASHSSSQSSKHFTYRHLNPHRHSPLSPSFQLPPAEGKQHPTRLPHPDPPPYYTQFPP